MDMDSQKRIAARIMKCGVSRVRIRHSEEVEEALTREDIRGLIQKGMIWRLQKKGTSKFASKRRLEQKRKGRMRGPGKRKGTKGARKNDKTKWIEKVRPLRRLLSELRKGGQIERRDYGILYRRAKGGFFRNRKHLLYYLREHDVFKSPRKPKPTSKGKSRVASEAKWPSKPKAPAKGTRTGKHGKAPKTKPARRPAARGTKAKTSKARR